MRKILSLIVAGICAGTLSGQQPVDILLKTRALLESGKTSDAIEKISAAIENEGSYRLYLQRAEAFILQGDYSKAISDFNSANNLSPASGEYGLARIYGLKGDPATSVYHLELCLKSAFKRSEKDIMLDPAFSIIENKAEWKQFWKKDWYDGREKSLSELEYYVSTGNMEEAVNIQAFLSKNYPGDLSAAYSGAVVSYARGKYPDAVRMIMPLLDKDPVNEKYLRLLARAQIGSGNYTGASGTLSRLLNIGVADPDFLVTRSECYSKTGEFDKAIEDAKQYADLYPDSRKALSLAGKMESASGNNLKALEYFSRNLELHPSDPECYVDRANSYFLSRSWEWAAKDYSMSLDLKPDNPEVWLNKGISLLNSGKVEDACYDFRKSFSLGNKKATDYLSRNCIK